MLRFSRKAGFLRWLGHGPAGPAAGAAPAAPPTYWSRETSDLLAALASGRGGLPAGAVEARRKLYGPNTLAPERRTSAAGLFLRQLKSPLVLILIFAALVSLGVGEWTDASIVLAVVLGSTVLGFVQEYRAGQAVARLQSQVVIKSTVLRDDRQQEIPASELVPGDLVVLSAGSLIPGDGVVLEADDFFVNQAVLTGETFPVEKRPGPSPALASLTQRTNCVFMGTSAGSGTARVLLVETGRATVFGRIAERLSLRPAETAFERGIHQFGNLLTQVMLVMVVIVLAVNLLFSKPPIDSLLFALALAVGLTPELLPAILSITLSHGAQRMAKRGVIVRRLNAIENLGSMDVLCTDKTGTLTEGVVRLDEALDAAGQASPSVLRHAFLNASFQSGLDNALDGAVVARGAGAGLALADDTKIDEIPYDFVRKRLSVVVENREGVRTLITKGALDGVLGICGSVLLAEDVRPLDAEMRARIEQRFGAWSAQGFRVLGVATKAVEDRRPTYTRDDERGLVFGGFLLFFDPPKGDVERVIADLTQRGVALKLITGDNLKVALHVAEAVGLPVVGTLTGGDLNALRDEALWHLAERTTVFAEVDPNQKERIILALRKTGHVVGYMGDGINDAPALHAADVGITVSTAVDVAKGAADFVLLKTDLGVLLEGIHEGRRTFANTLKYILTTISANFGNMFSMAGASMVLPFLPLLAPQILLNNFLSDIPAVTIAGDNVDREWLDKPQRWNGKFIRDYMVLFGLVSSLFDLLTFATLLFVFHATPKLFRTGWFVESLLTELAVALVVRTRHLFFRSRPSPLFLWSSLLGIGFTLVLAYLPWSAVFGFTPMPLPLLLAMVGLTLLYLGATEIAKKVFYARLTRAAG